MVAQIRPMTVEDFDQFAEQPENNDKLLEFIAGEIVEVPSNAFVSMIGSLFLTYINLFVLQHDLGFVTGEAGGYMVSGERYAPDVAFISKLKQPELAHQGYNPNPPDLAVEVISPGDNEHKLRIKLANYLAAGTVTWLVYPETKTVEVFVPGKPVQVIGIEGTLDGGDVLPGFTLALKDIFKGE